MRYGKQLQLSSEDQLLTRETVRILIRWTNVFGLISFSVDKTEKDRRK